MVAAVPSQKKRRRIERRFILLRRFSPSSSFVPAACETRKTTCTGTTTKPASLPFPSLPFPSSSSSTSQHSQRLLSSSFSYSSSLRPGLKSLEPRVPLYHEMATCRTRGTRRERILKHRSPPIERKSRKRRCEFNPRNSSSVTRPRSGGDNRWGKWVGRYDAPGPGVGGREGWRKDLGNF